MVPGVPLYEHNPIPGVTQPGTIQWLNPDAFVSAVDPSTGACTGGDSPANCQFGNLGRNALRGPDFVWSDLYLTKWFQLTERVKLRIDGQFFNVFNHPNFGLPVLVYAGIPGKPSTQTGFGALSYPTSPPTGLLGVGLGGDSSPADDRVSGAAGVLEIRRVPLLHNLPPHRQVELRRGRQVRPHQIDVRHLHGAVIALRIQEVHQR